MRNGKYFPTIDQERPRFRDTLRFLFFGAAYKRRFAARAAGHGIVFSSPQPSHRFLFAGAVMLVAILSVAGWLGGQLHEARIRNQAMAAELHGLRQRGVERQAEPLPQTALLQTALPQIKQAQAAQPAPSGNTDDGVRQALSDLEREQAGSRDLGEQLKQTREQLDSLRLELSGSKMVETRLSDQLRESELRLNGLTAEVTRLQAGRAEDVETIASQKFGLRELTDRLNAESDTVDRERKLLVADLDIRELMGARSLHIVDVFDVDGKGKTQRPFGRVFYTEGKSLIFYAFDLKGGATFQAWGQREARDESAQSLGLFYIDDQKQNRWILKFEDPKVLAEINAVFVTVEPPGGSVKPNRQKMLYAYLNATPNHP
jgi:hypothetical protein